LLPHLPFFFSFGIAECSLADFCLSHQRHAFTLEMTACACSSLHQVHVFNYGKSDMMQRDPCADTDKGQRVLFSATGP
jgi:hypothetical protein